MKMFVVKDLKTEEDKKLANEALHKIGCKWIDETPMMEYIPSEDNDTYIINEDKGVSIGNYKETIEYLQGHLNRRNVPVVTIDRIPYMCNDKLQK